MKMTVRLKFTVIFLTLLSNHLNGRRLSGRNGIIHLKLPEINDKFNTTTHLQFKHIQELCSSRYSCQSNDTNVCAMRYTDGVVQFMDFENACFLFLSNMCDNPGREYNIAWSGECGGDRRTLRLDDDQITENVEDSESTEHIGSSNVASENEATDIGILRQNKTKDKQKTTKTPTLTTTTDASTTKKARESVKPKTKKPKTTTVTSSTLYDIDTAFDNHICPLSCPSTYSPTCLSVNRGFGKYFKFFTFINHCLGDQYYCKHWEEFSPPPDEAEMVSSSPLSWSFCGASRYIAFARFAEVASSMSHFGWLAGDYRATHIMEPHQRIPGYGK